MIMCILLYHKLILKNQIQAPAYLASPRMHLNLDENMSQGEELGVWPHPAPPVALLAPILHRPDPDPISDLCVMGIGIARILTFVVEALSPI